MLHLIFIHVRLNQINCYQILPICISGLLFFGTTKHQQELDYDYVTKCYRFSLIVYIVFFMINTHHDKAIVKIYIETKDQYVVLQKNSRVISTLLAVNPRKTSLIHFVSPSKADIEVGTQDDKMSKIKGIKRPIKMSTDEIRSDQTDFSQSCLDARSCHGMKKQSK